MASAIEGDGGGMRNNSAYNPVNISFLGQQKVRGYPLSYHLPKCMELTDGCIADVTIPVHSHSSS